MIFDRSRYESYLEAYNSEDWEAVYREFFTDDAALESEELDLRGKDILSFLVAAHDGIKETLVPRRVVVGPENVAAELAITFTATRDMRGFPLVPLGEGESVETHWTAFYDHRDGRISRLAVYRWPFLPAKPRATAFPPLPGPA